MHHNSSFLSVVSIDRCFAMFKVLIEDYSLITVLKIRCNSVQSIHRL